MSVIIQLLFLPVTALNWFGGLVGIVWLLILGQWLLVAIGFLATILSSTMLRRALGPSQRLGTYGVALANRNHAILGGLLMLFGEAWGYFVMFLWCFAAFQIGLNAWHGTDPLYPYLLWSYAVATAPFTFEAVIDQTGVGSFLAALAACVGAIIVMALALLGTANVQNIVVALITPMMVGLLAQTVLTFEVLKSGAGR